ncbi:hypothetical protein [Ferrovibrio sp.]|uniref:hypothetical protein n=1 Tax=Ferrovibrio sp. TaxID=1917215 RepID=UPI00311D4871
MTYTRENPSPRFQQLLGFYRQLHDGGDPEMAIPPEEMFDGHAIMAHAGFLRDLIEGFRCRSVLDYGAGKAMAYTSAVFKRPDGSKARGLKEYWGVDEVVLYDPGYEPYATLPARRFHAVISTDVMEHIPEEDVDWVIDELFGFAERMVYACISTYPAQKHFPDGSNVHVTLRDSAWWLQRFRARKAALGSDAEFILVVYRDASDKAPEILTSFPRPQ